MKGSILILLFLFTIPYLNAQNDFIIPMAENHFDQGDTIFGTIKIPKNGFGGVVRIKTTSGKRKTFYPRQIFCFKASDIFVASIPYLDDKVFAQRIIQGNLELYYYNPGFIIYGLGGVGFSLGAISTASHTHFFIKKDSTSNKYMMVPHSTRKIRMELADFFKSNEKCYTFLKSSDFSEEKIPELIDLYNTSTNSQK